MMARRLRSNGPSPRAILMDASPSSSMPGWLNLVSIPVVAMSASVILNLLAAPFIDMKYQAVSSDPKVWLTSSLLAWRVVELWIGWSLGLDDLDVFGLFLQTRAPYYIFMNFFYEISIPTVVASVLIDAGSPFIAFALLGRHRGRKSPQQLLKISPEFYAIQNHTNTALVILLSSTVYALGLYLSAVSFLPTFVVSHFTHVTTLVPIHNVQGQTGLPTLAALFVPLGWAASTVLFSSSAFGKAPISIVLDDPFDNSSAYRFLELGFWIRTTRGMELLKRTGAVFVITIIGNTLRMTNALQGSTFEGATVWASIWAVTGLFVNLVLIWVGSAAYTDPRLLGRPEVTLIDMRGS